MTNTITLPRSAVEQALHAIKYSSACVSKQLTTQTKHDYALGLLAEANDALHTALEQPQVEPEPVAYYVERHAPGMRDHSTKLGPFWKREDAEGWLDEHHQMHALYTHPQPRKPLTDEEIFNAIRPLCNNDTNCRAIIRLSIDEYRAIERAHGIGGEA